MAVEVAFAAQAVENRQGDTLIDAMRRMSGEQGKSFIGTGESSSRIPANKIGVEQAMQLYWADFFQAKSYRSIAT
jgi:hypothetical protein